MATKYSLHFGLNAVDKNAYLNRYRDLRNAENDARLYFSIGQTLNFNSEIHIGPEAISHNLITKLHSLADQMQDGDLLFLTYSGHGTKATDINGDEIDKKDEVLVLYDRLFIDDEFPLLWNRFHPGVRIFFVNDSCFNGTVSKFMFDNNILKQNIYRGIDQEAADPDFQRNIGYYRSIEKPASPAACSIIHIGSCRDNQLASDGIGNAQNGLFTSRFSDLYLNGQFNGDYATFYKSLKSKMPIIQIPTWDTSAGNLSSNFSASRFLFY